MRLTLPKLVCLPLRQGALNSLRNPSSTESNPRSEPRLRAAAIIAGEHQTTNLDQEFASLRATKLGGRLIVARKSQIDEAMKARKS